MIFGKALKFIGVLIFSITAWTAFAQSGEVELEAGAASLEEVILQLESRYAYLFSYREEDIQNRKVSIPSGKMSIDRFLTALLADSELRFEIVQGNYILLSRREPPEKETDPGPPLLLLCGTVVDSFTQEPLPFANIYLQSSGKGSYAAKNGTFRFQSPIGPNDSLVISYVGYQEKRLPAAAFVDRPCPLIALPYLDFGEDFIVVTDYLVDGIDLGENGASTVIRPSRTGVLPGQVEPDVLNTIQFLPGIAAPDGEASNIYIRGGTPDQNLILWEDIPIYHSAHYFGMISAFNPYIMDKIKVYRGGFGPAYGGRISGVIDMRSKGADLQQSNFGAGANFLYGFTNGQVSLFQKKASVVYSLRRSISELWRSPAFESITERNLQGVLSGNLEINRLPRDLSIDDQFHFFDTQVKGAVELSGQDDLAFAYFHGTNDFADQILHGKKKQEQLDSLRLSNQGASISWKRDWQNGFSSKLLGVVTDYMHDYAYDILSTDGNAPDKFGVKNNNIQERQIHFSTTYQSPGRHEIEVGYQWINYDVAYQITHESDREILANEQDAFQSDLHIGHAGISSDPEGRGGFDLGLRMSYYRETQRNYFEPRLRLWYQPSEALTLNGNVGKYYQFLSQLIEFKGDNTGIETPIWVLAEKEKVPVLNAWQYQVGLIYHKGSWVIDLQAYHKKIAGLTSLATGFDPTPQEYDLGYSTIRGVDLLLKKRWNWYSTWISYSLSQVDYEFVTFFDPEFAAPYDQRHSLSWANLFDFGSLECSLGWKLSSGKPFSVLDRFEIVKGAMGKDVVHPFYQAYNDHTLPMQHHLDASVLYKLQDSKNGKWRGVIGLSLFNIYQQENIFNREYFVDLRRNESPKIERVDKRSLGFTPNAVIRLEW